MKKISLTLGLFLMVSSAHSQSYGAGLGGSMGGTNSTTSPTGIPTNTLPRTNDLSLPTQIESNQQSIQEQETPPDSTIMGTPQSIDGVNNSSTPAGMNNMPATGPSAVPSAPSAPSAPAPSSTTPGY